MNEQLKQFIKEELLEDGESVTINDDDNLLMTEVVDSLGMMRLVRFIEEQWSVEVPPEDVTIEHFMSIETMCRYLEERLK